MPTIVPRAIWIGEDGEQARISVGLKLGVEVICEKVGSRDLGFESWGLRGEGIGVWNIGFRFQGLRVQGLGFRM
jgi:hypothetical protein